MITIHYVSADKAREETRSYSSLSAARAFVAARIGYEAHIQDAGHAIGFDGSKIRVEGIDCRKLFVSP